MAVLAASMVKFHFDSRQPSRLPVGGISSPQGSVQEMAAQLGELEAREREADQTVWAKERLAEECGAVFDRLWDSLNAATNKLKILAAFPFHEINVANYKPPQSIGHGIELFESNGNRSALSPGNWRRLLRDREAEGWQLLRIEIRHNRFEVDSSEHPARSEFYFSAHLVNASSTNRAILEGSLVVDWSPSKENENTPRANLSNTNSSRSSQENNFVSPNKNDTDSASVLEGVSEATNSTSPKIQGIDATQLKIKTRHGEPAFRPLLTEEISPPPGSFFIDPLILYDLDGDGLSEIILAARNQILRRTVGGSFVPEPLCKQSPGLIMTGVIADFDGDGFADFLCAKFEGLVLFHGSKRGIFDESGQIVWTANPRLKYAQVLACGDIDGDGDLDVWLGQYRVPYERGAMPTPYYDANDGNPAYLLVNDGHGHFTDATVAAGLDKKRFRRSYSGSFADLNGDGHLDLLVVSDFAGVDLYLNDGRGHFRDVTREWIEEPHGFGMAHTIADFNSDGRLDFLMIGMNSPTAERLEHLGIHRTETPTDQAVMRSMIFGNRLFVSSDGSPRFQQTTFNNEIARTGWSWGCSAFDFDNDGFPDVYIANGHETKQSVREYEPEFWLHDIYVANSKESVVNTAYFGTKIARTRGRGESYGGREKNRLFLNQHGESFVEIAHLMDVSLEADSRNVVADDLDGDGRMDLLVTTFEVWPQIKQTLRVFKNSLADGGNWIGFRLREQGGGISPVGAQVTLRHANGAMTHQIVTGDSYRSQHANTVHFGLGKIARVEQAEIRWTNGRTLVLRQPELNQYHTVLLPVQETGRTSDP